MTRLLIVTLLVFAASPTVAVQFCSLGLPSMREGLLRVPLTCAAIASGATVPYPTTALFVGATLYRLEAGLRGKVAPLRSPEKAYDLSSVAVTAGRVPGEVTFELGNAAGFSHFLVAVWDRKTECGNGDEGGGGGGCDRYRYTLGRVDRLGMPIPIDVWPRPVCNKAELERAGFFAWVKNGGEPDGREAEPRIQQLLELNDCWAATGPIGLGFSVRTWRVGPLPIE